MPNQALYDLSNQNVLTVGGDKDYLLDKLLYAINHATEIDIAVSFIQPSGLDLILPAITEAIEKHVEANTSLKLRVITSDYLDITSPVALRKLVALKGEQVDLKIFEAGRQSFHMKSYIFVRTDEANSFYQGSAFIGSNNISKSALQSGHEWCLRYDYEQPDDSFQAQQFKLIRTQFDSIFHHDKAATLTDTWISDYINRRKPPKLSQVITNDFIGETEEEYAPNSAQQEALFALSETRENGFKQGLVVLATGMGKTYLSAFDAKQMQAKRVLFVAHREEILSQALNTFAKVWPEKTSGFYNASSKDTEKDMLFASVQTLGKQSHLKKFEKDDFDYIVVDEFHHASAKTYRNLISYFEPKFLLGLTATPERSDQADILSLCSNNLVFRKTLTDGIESKILMPFHYHGIWDEFVNYQEIPWRNGKFDPKSLDAAFATQKRTQHVLKHWELHQQSRTLAFCVSKTHADFMADAFNTKYANQGLKAVSVHSSSSVKRNEALSQLDKGEVQVIFSIDLFNEGTDLPSIDTVMMLRPTESMIIFLQQLGRGLRLHKNKSHLMVLDFIGNHHSFGNQIFSAVSGNAGDKRKPSVPKLPVGCYVNYEPKLIDFWKTLKLRNQTSIDEFRELEGELGHRPTATEFYLTYLGHRPTATELRLAESGLKKVNKQHGSWFSLVESQLNSPEFSAVINEHHDFLLFAVQTTAMAKSFKAILLQAFLQLDGFNTPPTLESLAETSYKVLSSYPEIKGLDLASKELKLSATDKGWLSYWNKNPVKFSCVADKKTNIAWFTQKDGRYVANFDVLPEHIDILHECVQELVDYRLSRYVETKKVSKVEKVIQQDTEIESLPDNVVELPYFPNLQIACGHFKTGTSDDMQTMAVDLHNVDPAKHFLARASGNSMNGGKNPILDGDLLLLELMAPERAGSITGNTIAIETQDEAGDNQYLLRVVEKRDGQYWLRANNPKYKPISANADMKTFARLKRVL